MVTKMGIKDLLRNRWFYTYVTIAMATWLMIMPVAFLTNNIIVSVSLQVILYAAWFLFIFKILSPYCRDKAYDLYEAEREKRILSDPIIQQSIKETTEKIEQWRESNRAEQ